MASSVLIPVSALLFVVLAASGCSENATDAAPASGGAAETAPSQLPARAGASVTTDDLAALQRGLLRETEAVRAAQARSASAKTPQERGEAIQASFETATIPLGAQAAGLPVARYQEVRETVNGVLQTLDFQGKIDGPLEVDLSRVDAATKERLSRDAYDGVPEATAAAIRTHLEQIVPVWIAYVSLTAVNG